MKVINFEFRLNFLAKQCTAVTERKITSAGCDGSVYGGIGEFRKEQGYNIRKIALRWGRRISRVIRRMSKKEEEEGKEVTKRRWRSIIHRSRTRSTRNIRASRWIWRRMLRSMKNRRKR